MAEHSIQMHALLPHSRVNGPGQRAVVWVQGCSLGCVGCFNPYTHTRHGGTLMTVEALTAQIVGLQDIEGITLSGGEPLQQAASVLALLRAIRQQSTLSSVLFTGYTWDEIQCMPLADELPQLVDVLITGRYDATQRVAAGLMGSANKQIHFLTPRYGPADFQALPVAEVRIQGNGTVIMTGINPVQLVEYDHD